MTCRLQLKTASGEFAEIYEVGLMSSELCLIKFEVIVIAYHIIK